MGQGFLHGQGGGVDFDKFKTGYALSNKSDTSSMTLDFATLGAGLYIVTARVDYNNKSSTFYISGSPNVYLHQYAATYTSNSGTYMWHDTVIFNVKKNGSVYDVYALKGDGTKILVKSGVTSINIYGYSSSQCFAKLSYE